MVNEKILADCGSWMNVDAGSRMGEIRSCRRGISGICFVQNFAGDTIDNDGFDGWITQNNFFMAFGGGIARKRRFDIFLDFLPKYRNRFDNFGRKGFGFAA